jgi:subtilase family serine protease
VLLVLAAVAIAVAATAGRAQHTAAHGGMVPDTLRTPNMKQQIYPVSDPSALVRFTCQLPLEDAQRTSPYVCYGPEQMREAYGVSSLYAKGYDGAGKTIAIIDAYGSQTLDDDLATFDSVWNLPAADYSVVAPYGVDPTDPDNADGWAGETSLDVEWAHAIAPGAKIVLVVAKSNNDSDILDATQYAIDNNVGDVISQSFGEGESCMAKSDLQRQHKLFSQAVRQGITLFASSGDQGATQPDCNNDGGYFKSTSTPASDPNVTSVGGTTLVADPPTGTYQSESTWNENDELGDAAGGGGQSILFREPVYQLLAQRSGKRQVPDVSYNAAVLHGVIVVQDGGAYLFGGTSAGSPQWAAITSIVDQIARHRVGNINPALYALAKLPGSLNPFHDVADGSNNSAPDGNGGTITGFTAVRGYDMATGLGSPNIGALAPLIAKLPAVTTATN